MLIQTRLPDDVLVCDDGSKDATLDLLEDFKGKAPFPVRVVRNKQNLKMTKNFEKCIGLCSGDFIVPCDFDDAWYPDKLEVLLRTLQDNPDAGYVCSDAALMDENGKPISGSLLSRLGFQFLKGRSFPATIEVATLLKKNIVWGSAMMMRSEIRRYTLPFSAVWEQDTWTAMLASLTGDFGIVLNQQLMKYRLHAAQGYGVHPRPSKLLAHLRKAPRDLWEKQLLRFQELRDNLRARPDLLSRCKTGDLELLDQKIAHLKERDLARTSTGVQRWRTVFREARTGRYQQFSFSWNSVVRDLLV